MVRPDDILLPRALVPERVIPAELFGRTEPRPVELELGSGKGKFLVEAARRCPEHDFIGVEIVGALTRKIRDKTVRAGLENVRVLQAEAKDLLARRLPDACVRRLHVYFPDPWPKRRHAKHRLFAGTVAADALRILEPGGELFLATDFDPYFRDVVATLGAHPELIRVLPDPFREIPPGGFDAIFSGANIPIFRAVWQRALPFVSVPLQARAPGAPDGQMQGRRG